METKVTLLEENVNRNNKQIEKLNLEMEQLKLCNYGIERDVVSINSSIQKIENTVKKTDERLQIYMDESVNNRYIQPLKNYKKIVWLIVGIITSFLMGVLLSNLFPGIN